MENNILFLNCKRMLVNILKSVLKFLILLSFILSFQKLYAKDYRSNPEIGSFSVNKTEKISTSKNYMIVCADKRAAIAAENIIKMGGNAIDAAIAAQAVLSVVEPQSSGLGGGGFLIYYNKQEDTIYGWDGRETAPSNATKNMFLSDNKKISFLKAVSSGISVGVPGLFSMLADVHINHGNIKWETIINPAINIAEKGFRVSKRLNKMLSWAPHIKTNELARELYFDLSGNPHSEGTFIKNMSLANSLKILSSDPYSINKGIISNNILLTLNKLSDKNLLTKKDLNDWSSIKRIPICKYYREHKICGMPPPTSGGIGVLQILGILENYELNKLGSKNILSKHLFAEASRLSYADRDAYIADPQYFKVPTKKLLSDNYLLERNKLISIYYANKNVKEGKIKIQGSNIISPDHQSELNSTTHISIIDHQGNAVSLTSSIEFAFGSGIISGGFFLNNQLTDFSFVPYKDNQIVANSVQPKKRPRSSMSPTMIFDRSNTFIGAIGSPGGSRIICYVTEAIINIIDYNLSAEEIINMPHICSRNMYTEIENISSGDSIAIELKKWDIR